MNNYNPTNPKLDAGEPTSVSLPPEEDTEGHSLGFIGSGEASGSGPDGVRAAYAIDNGDGDDTEGHRKLQSVDGAGPDDFMALGLPDGPEGIRARVTEEDDVEGHRVFAADQGSDDFMAMGLPHDPEGSRARVDEDDDVEGHRYIPNAQGPEGIQARVYKDGDDAASPLS